MSAQPKRSIRAQLTRLSLIIVAVSVALSLAGTLYVTLREEQRALDKNLINSASILSQSPLVREALEGTAQSEELAAYLDAATAFTPGQERTKRVAAIFITETGAPDEPLIGMLTPWDILGKAKRQIVQPEHGDTRAVVDEQM